MRRNKIIICFCIILLLSILTVNITFAASSITDPRDNPSTYDPGSMAGTDRVADIGNRIIGIIQFVGSFASVIVLIILGIKYMTGSLEERAEYKKTMMPYVIGAVLVFGITNILGIVNSITDGVL